VPEVVFDPAQPPLAVQDVVLVEDHVRVEEEPEVMEVGLAEIERVGAATEETTTCMVSDPVAPRLSVAVKLKI